MDLKRIELQQRTCNVPYRISFLGRYFCMLMGQKKRLPAQCINNKNLLSLASSELHT